MERCADRSDGGFVLVSVLWAVALIAASTAVFVNVIGMHAQAGAALDRNATAEAAADGTIRLIAYRLAFESLAGDQPPLPRNSETFVCAPFPGTHARVAIQDQDGLIDLNHGPLPLLAMLLRRTLDAAAAAKLLATIQARRATAAEMSSSVDDSGSFRHPDELLQWAGDNHDAKSAIRSLLTVYSQSDGLDPEIAPEALLAILQSGGGGVLPAEIVRHSRSKVFAVTAEVGEPSHGRSIRRAVVELLRLPDQPYAIREWSSLGQPFLKAFGDPHAEEAPGASIDARPCGS